MNAASTLSPYTVFSEREKEREKGSNREIEREKEAVEDKFTTDSM